MIHDCLPNSCALVPWPCRAQPIIEADSDVPGEGAHNKDKADFVWTRGGGGGGGGGGLMV